MPSQSQLFDTYMRGVWENVLVDADGNDAYTNQHNATITAQAFGAKPTDGSCIENDEPWHEWLFPDGSTTWIADSGNGTTSALP